MTRRALLALAVMLVLPACASALAPPAAVVGGHKIPTKAVTAALRSFQGSAQFQQASQQSPPQVVSRQFEQSYLSRLIRRYILQTRARQLGVTVTSADIDQALAKLEKNYPSKDAFRTAAAQQGLTLAQVRPLIRDGVLEKKLRARVAAHHLGDVSNEQVWQRWLVAAYKAAHVNVNPRYGRLDLQNQLVVDTNGSFPGGPSPSPTPSPSPSG